MRSIPIRTAHNATIEYELAGAALRVLAFLIDMVVVFAVYVFILLLIQPRGISEQVIFFFLPLAFFLLYYFLAETLLRGRTLGKIAQRIRVLRIDGKNPTPADFLVRSVFLLPDAWFSFAVPGIVLMNTTPRAQRLGDLVAGTVVVRSRGTRSFYLHDIQRIKSVDNYEPVYPSIVQFTEADMLLIKSSLRRLKQYNNEAHHRAVSQLAERCRQKLDVENQGRKDPDFLNTLLQDYIVLTR